MIQANMVQPNVVSLACLPAGIDTQSSLFVRLWFLVTGEIMSRHCSKNYNLIIKPIQILITRLTGRGKFITTI